MRSAFIQHVYTNNAATMKEGQVRYGLVCNEQGGIRDDVLVYRWPYGYAMVVNACNREKIVAWLAQHKGGRDVEIVDRTTGHLHGRRAGAEGDGTVPRLDRSRRRRSWPITTLRRRAIRSKDCVVSRTGYTGEDGVELIVPAALGVDAVGGAGTAAGRRPCGLGARDTLRLEAAMPLYGHELSEEIDPLQAGLGWAVKLDKGDFIGRDALLRRQKETRPRRVRVGLELGGKRIAREGAAVLAGAHSPIGVVTSGTFAPTLQKAIAMAYVAPGIRGRRAPLARWTCAARPRRPASCPAVLPPARNR